MRILHVIQELGRGGAERSTAILVEGARTAGHDVAIVAAPGRFGAAFAVPTFSLPLVHRRPHRLALAALAVRRAIHEWRPDLIHCHNPSMAMATGLASRWSAGPPKIVTIHGLRDTDYAMTSRMLRWLSIPTIACGPGVAAALRDHGLASQTIRNGVSPPPPPANRADLEREFPAIRNRRLFVAVGRLAQVKNFALLVRAFVRLPAAAVVIAGEGPLRGALQDEIARCDVAERVILAGYRSDARALMGASDGVVITSLSEGLPLVALEALAAARPIVATRARWLSGVLTHERDSLVVEPGDPAALARAIERLVIETELAARLSANARRQSLAYTEARAVEEYLALYRTLARGAQG